MNKKKTLELCRMPLVFSSIALIRETLFVQSSKSFRICVSPPQLRVLFLAERWMFLLGLPAFPLLRAGSSDLRTINFTSLRCSRPKCALSGCCCLLAVSDIWVDEEIYAISMAICSRLCAKIVRLRSLMGEDFFFCFSSKLPFRRNSWSAESQCVLRWWDSLFFRSRFWFRWLIF